MTKLITIDYDEYLELIKCKKMLDEAKSIRVSEFYQDPMTYTVIQRCICTDLFNYLAESDAVTELKIVRDIHE